MRSSLRSALAPARPGALALAVCLLAPHLPHTHGQHSVPVATSDEQPCTSRDAAAHLHAASARLAPACPACAAGPSSAPAPASDARLCPAIGSEPLALRAERAATGALRANSRTRAPPRLPAV